MTYGRCASAEVTACPAISQIFWLVRRVGAGGYGVPLFTVFLEVVDIATLTGMQAMATTGCGGFRSQVAGLKNTCGHYGGIGTSAKFIEHFTEGDPWAHVNMASMGLAEDDKPAQPKGATGKGVRLFAAFLEAWGKQ
jgi:leucyl aminopeptidase